MFYSHDTYGLGHIRRTLCLLRALRERAPETEVLLATGSPVLEQLSIPTGVRVLHLKPVLKTGAESYVARDGSMSRDQVLEHRSQQLHAAARFFRPDVLVVDHAPLGMKGELVAALEFLRRHLPSSRTVLGLRDIIDEPDVVRRTWKEQGVYDALERFYDRILVYGERHHFPIEREYDLSDDVCGKLEYVGYIRKQQQLAPHEKVRERLGVPGLAPLVVATVGGGGDGAELLQTTVAAVGRLRRKWPSLHALVVTGPLMDVALRQHLEDAVAKTPGLRIESFVPDLASTMAASDVVIGMGGYNTVTEILALGCRSVLVPRVTPRKEQWIRARIFERRALAHVVDPVGLTPERLARAVARALVGPAPRALALRGTDNAVAAICSLFGEETAFRTGEYPTHGVSRTRGARLP